MSDHALEAAEVFRLLGDATRLRILLACLEDARNVGDIAAAVGASASLVSHHLRLLRAVRLVRADRRGRHVFYSADDDHVRRIIADMMVHVAEPREGED
ncbi:MAG: helix-turn-helix transcriptional regulator [Hyphomicrobiales bacterium]|nr:helix-turn-helix transcriptional regulator [Hyphomicrobiales bacterium]MCP5370399.1 helix-turn-helix transcriptional regulator [Hyphomicrobiales bacterium]